MDLDRVVGALLGGAAKPPRRRKASSSAATRSRSRAAADPLAGLGLVFGGRSRNARLGRALATLAGVAVEALAKSGRSSAPPDAAAGGGPAPRMPSSARRGSGGGVPDLVSAPVPPPVPRAPAPPRRLPETGAASPWSATPVPRDTDAGGASPGPGAEDAEALLMIRAMIAAARADGAVDAEERARIAHQLDAAGLSAEDRDIVLADFDRPMTPEALAEAACDPMLAAQLYAAAFATASASGDLVTEERAWLDALLRALRLDPAAAQAIEARLTGAA